VSGETNRADFPQARRHFGARIAQAAHEFGDQRNAAGDAQQCAG
jgi:hypothetical protein